MPMETKIATAPQAVKSSPEQATVLLACNHQGHRQELATLLQTAGHRVLFPPSLAEACRAAASGDILIFKTLVIREDLFELLRSLEESATGWRPPVIILADIVDTKDACRCLELGAVECATWPVDTTRLLARVKAAAARKHLWLAEAALAAADAKARQEAELLVSSLIPLSLKMVRESDPLKLLEMILVEGMRITDCEGGSIYLRTPEETLQFVLVRNDMLDVNMGGSTGKPITFKPLPLREPDGKPVHRYVSTYSALTGQIVNIEDAYVTGRFDFSGTRLFDSTTGYHSKSFLTVPLKNARQQVTGVLQLINARDRRTGTIVAFDSSLQPIIEAFAIVAAAVLEAYREKHKGQPEAG
jgi:DNA-binding response OmpR family regulator